MGLRGGRGSECGAGTAAKPLMEKNSLSSRTFGIAFKPLRGILVCATQRSAAASIGQRTTGHGDGGLETKGLGRATSSRSSGRPGIPCNPPEKKGEEGEEEEEEENPHNFTRISFLKRD